MTLAEIMSRNYSFVAAADLDDGGWVIKYPDLPGCITTADSYEEIATQAKGALEAWVEATLRNGDPIPEPSDYPLPEWDWATEGTDSEVLTTNQVAEHLGVSPRRVRAIAQQRNIGRKIGQTLTFRRAELPKLIPGARGRPRSK